MEERDPNISVDSQTSFTSQEKLKFEKYLSFKRTSRTYINNQKVLKKMCPWLDPDPSSNAMIHTSLDKLAIEDD